MRLVHRLARWRNARAVSAAIGLAVTFVILPIPFLGNAFAGTTILGLPVIYSWSLFGVPIILIGILNLYCNFIEDADRRAFETENE